MDEITAEDEPSEVSTYSYNNPYMKDVLTHYTSTDGIIDTDILFDEVGNITYFNGQTYTWNANRQLETVLTADNDLIRYYYNENGFLTRLDTYENNDTVCNGSMSYIWNGDVLVARTVSDYESGETIVSKVVYDSEDDAVGTVITQTADGVTNEQFLLYRKNLQGDITGLIDSTNGTLVASYTYDAYGNVSFQPINDNNLSLLGSALMFALLPQSYRGYTFSFVGDELCYYLGSRFYSPRLGRFLNADKHFDTGTGVLGTNVFAYCNNNPVMFTDPSGEIIRIFNFLKTAIALIKKVVTAITSGKISTETIKNDAIWPVETLHSVGSAWGFRHFDGKHHQGIDIFVSYGTPVYAVADGTVVVLDASCSTSQGIYIVLKHEMDGMIFYTRYMHLSIIQPGLVKGQSVAMGEQIGKSGNTATDGPTGTTHLHFQIQLENIDSRSKTINPCEFYHKEDTRYNSKNPNPFYIYKNGKYVFNEAFSIKKSFEYFNSSNENHWSVSIESVYQT